MNVEVLADADAVAGKAAAIIAAEARAAIAARSGGFLYCVSLVGVTGARSTLPTTVGRLVRDVVAASPVPVGVGFGVSRPAHVRALVRAGADGVIVASALVDALGPDGRDVERMGKLIRDLVAATGAAAPPARTRRARVPRRWWWTSTSRCHGGAWGPS